MKFAYRRVIIIKNLRYKSVNKNVNIFIIVSIVIINMPQLFVLLYIRYVRYVFFIYKRILNICH